MGVNIQIVCLLFTSLLVNFGDCIRCYECRSDIQLSCGDPFFPGNIPVTECTHRNTNPTFMCFKASQYVGGTYITVRGCAPFDTETFDLGLQRQMTGTYWKGFNVFSMCDYDNCNSGHRINLNFTLMALLVAGATTFFRM